MKSLEQCNIARLDTGILIMVGASRALHFVIYIVLLTMFFFKNEAVLANETELKYPPYPNVWGYEIPIISNSSLKTYPIDLFKLPDGDILITYPTDRSKPIYEYVGLSFFSQYKWGNEVNDLMNRLPRASTELGITRQLFKIVFNDETYLVQETNHPLGCYDKTTEAFVLYAKDGHIIWNKKLIHVLQNPKPETNFSHCEEVGPFTRKVETYIWEVIPLEDDTFILVSGTYSTPFVFRFDKSLQTQYPLNPEWIVVDGDEWDKNAETAVGDYQTRINKQYNYLKSKIEQDKKP